MNHFFADMHELAKHVAGLSPQTLAIAVLLLICLMVLGRIVESIEINRVATGLSSRASAVSVDGSETLPVRNYVSTIQGLAGRPDAVIRENGYLIPVERKPLARKLRDRYVAQLLVYMRLIEEFEGKKPPYGYLILGPTARRVKIENSSHRQEWLQGILEEMRDILDGKPSVPTPQPQKCLKCDVREYCSARADLRDARIAANSTHETLVPMPKRSHG